MNNPRYPISDKLIRGMTLPEYDRKLAALRGLSAELGLPVMPDIHIGVKVVSADGEVLVDRYEQGHSWTRNAWSLFNSMMMDGPSPAAGATTGDNTYRKGYLNARSPGIGSTVYGSIGTMMGRATTSYANYGFQGGLNDAGVGITVGTSNIAFHGEDHELGNKVASGTGSGQLSYQAQPTPVTTWDAGANTFSCSYSRQFNNNSSGAIVVNEVGMNYYSSVGAILLSRDILAGPVNVPVGAQLTIAVVLTTTSYAALEGGVAARPALGAAYGGGTNIGWVQAWSSAVAGEVWGTYPTADNMAHNRYTLILSPKAGGESGALQLKTATPQTFAGTYNASGKVSTDYYMGLGALSPLGQFVTAANAAVLGGYSDWYIPSYWEIYAITQQVGVIPAGEYLTAAAHWTASQYNADYNYRMNAAYAVGGIDVVTTALIGRLVRRVLV